MDQESLHRIECHFLRQNRPMTENNKKQAMMPQGCIIFPNNNGTAPGCAIEGTRRAAGQDRHHAARPAAGDEADV